MMKSNKSDSRWKRDNIKLKPDFYNEKIEKKEENINEEIVDKIIVNKKINNKEFDESLLDFENISDKLCNLVIKKVEKQLEKQKIRSFNSNNGDICLLNNNYIHLVIDVRKLRENEKYILFDKTIPNKFSDQDIKFDCKSKLDRYIDLVLVYFEFDVVQQAYIITIPKLPEDCSSICGNAYLTIE